MSPYSRPAATRIAPGQDPLLIRRLLRAKDRAFYFAQPCVSMPGNGARLTAEAGSIRIAAALPAQTTDTARTIGRRPVQPRTGADVWD